MNNCECKRILKVSGKTSDAFNCDLDGFYYEGYVPDGINIGFAGDYISFRVCADCGKIQGWKPIQVEALMR